MKTNEPRTIECWGCREPFQWTRPDNYETEPRWCQTCAAIKIGKNLKDSQTRVEEEVLKLTPARYQATDIGHEDFNSKLWKAVKPWWPTARLPWIGIFGPTDRSKTRIAFLLLREIALGLVHPASTPDARPWTPTIAAVSAYTFAEAVAAKHGDDREVKAEAMEFLRRIRRVNVLLIDDLGKQRNTPAVSSELFALLDHRHAENLTTIWTSNMSPEGIVNGMAEDMAAPLAGRIRECSTIYNLA